MERTRTKCHLVFILDETGSMQPARRETVMEFNRFIQKLREDRTESEVFLTLTLFNSVQTRVLYERKDIRKIGEMLSLEDYDPNNLTPLFDAVGQTLTQTSVEPDELVMVVILTDGEENASNRFTKEDVFQMIAERRASGWEFIFLGANQDAWQSARQLGVQPGMAMGFSPANMAGTFACVYSAVSSYYDSGGMDIIWTTTEPDPTTAVKR